MLNSNGRNMEHWKTLKIISDHELYVNLVWLFVFVYLSISTVVLKKGHLPCKH